MQKDFCKIVLTPKDLEKYTFEELYFEAVINGKDLKIYKKEEFIDPSKIKSFWNFKYLLKNKINELEKIEFKTIDPKEPFNLDIFFKNIDYMNLYEKYVFDDNINLEDLNFKTYISDISPTGTNIKSKVFYGDLKELYTNMFLIENADNHGNEILRASIRVFFNNMWHVSTAKHLNNCSYFYFSKVYKDFTDNLINSNYIDDLKKIQLAVFSKKEIKYVPCFNDVDEVFFKILKYHRNKTLENIVYKPKKNTFF